MTKQDMIAQFLASKGATVCPPTGSHTDNARSLRHLRNETERRCDPLCEEDEEDVHVVEGVLMGGERGAVRVNADGEPC